MQAPSYECFLSFCHFFSLNDLLYNICGSFLPLHFLFLAHCPSTYQAVSSDIPTFYNKRKGSEWVSLQTQVLGNNQQTLCTLTTSERCYRIKHKGREQNFLGTGDVTVFFRRQPLDPLRLMCSKQLKSWDKRSFNSLVHHSRDSVESRLRAWSMPSEKHRTKERQNPNHLKKQLRDKDSERD